MRHPASFCRLACSDCLRQETFSESVSAGGACLAPDTCSQPHVPAECPLPLRLGKGCDLCISLARLPSSLPQRPSTLVRDKYNLRPLDLWFDLRVNEHKQERGWCEVTRLM